MLKQQQQKSRFLELKHPFGIDLRSSLVLAAALFTVHFGWVFWNKQRYYRTSDIVVAEYCFLASLSLLVLSLLNKFWKNIPKIAVSNLVVDMAGSIALFSSIWFLGLRQFGGYDHSALIESGWIQFSALVPFRDYPCTIPPLFFIGDKYAFLLFGVRWSAFVLLMACFATFSFLFLTWQLRTSGFSAASAAGLAMMAELGTNVVCSYWWYNPVTSVIGIMVFISAVVCLTTPHKVSSWVLLCISFTLLILAKPNTWPIGVCLMVLLSTRDSGHRLRAALVFLSGIALAAAMCWVHGLGLFDLLHTYSQIAETRGSPLSMQAFSDFIPVERTILLASIGVLVSLFLALLISRKSELFRYWREYCCCVTAALTSLGMAFTNYELKISDLMPLVVALAVVAFRPWSRRAFDSFGRVAVVAVATFVVVVSSYWGITRFRVRGIGEEMFFQDMQLQVIRDGFFTGLHSGPRLIAVLDQTSDALSRYPSAKVFFGPRLEFSYAAFNRSPPAGLPIWWHPGTSYSLSDLPRVLFSFGQDNFDVLIFLKGDFTRMPPPLLMYMDQFYSEVPGYSELGVYVRRKAS